MATRRRLLIGLLIAALLILPVVSWVGWQAMMVPEPVRAYRRLALGMTKDEAVNAIGVPPGWYATPGGMMTGPGGEYIRETGLPAARLDDSTGKIASGLTLERWTWDNYWIWIVFDEDRKVVGYYLLDSPGPAPSFFDRVRAFVGL